MHTQSCAIVLAFLAAALSPFTRTAAAQRSLPFSDDALVLSFGQARTGIHARWDFYDQIYSGDGKLRPYGSELSFSSAGSAQFPLSVFENGIRSASGQNSFQLSLGTTDVNAANRTGATVLLLDLGLPARFMVSLEVPIVRVETSVRIRANDGATTPANVGTNPAAGSAAAFTSDTSLGNQILRARNALNAQLAACQGNSAGSCASINARRSEAESLASRSLTVAAGVLTIAVSPFAPLTGSSAQIAITAAVAALARGYRDFGISTIAGTATVAAASPISAADYRQLLEHSTYGFGGALPAYKTLTRIGDVSVAGEFRVAETERFRIAAFGRVYFPTGGKTPGGELLPLSPGGGSARAEFGGVADFFPFGRLSLTASGATGEQMQPNAQSRPGMNFLITPRYALNRWMTVGTQYEWRKLPAQQAAAEKTLMLMSRNATGEMTGKRIGAGFSFSSLSGSGSSAPRFPVEASFFHSQFVSGTGLQPKFFTDEFRIRVFTRK